MYETTQVESLPLVRDGPRAYAHPLFKKLKKGARGMLQTSAIKWNFTKFLVARDGTIVDRYGPATKPEALADDIREQLGA
jgi:glutathione peroxidase